MRNIFKKAGAMTLAVIALLFVSMLSAGPASATGYPWNGLWSSTAQPGELAEINTRDAGCPTGVAPQMRTVMTDSSNQVTTTVIRNGNQTWSTSYLKIPATASLGAASFEVQCWDGSTLVRTMDEVNFTIVGQTSTITMDRFAIWSMAEIESVTSTCPSGSAVQVTVNGSDVDYSAYFPEVTRQVVINTTADVNGNWAVSLPIDEVNQWNYPLFTVGDKYYVRAMCSGYNYSAPTPYWRIDSESYSFIVEGDQYVALGDSYSAGEGSFNYDLNSGACHRTTDSYPYYVVDNVGLDLPNFGACSGAVTDDMFNSKSSTPWIIPQIDRLTDDTEYVTLTIGGNDAGFSEVVGACSSHIGNIGWSCANDTVMTGLLADRLGALAGTSSGSGIGPDGRNVYSIEMVVNSIATAAPDAEIFIAGYPHIFGDTSAGFTYDGDAPGSYKCVVHGSGATEVSVSLWDAQFLNDQADVLNGIIEDAVNDAKSQFPPVKVTYVDPSTFSGHGLCDTGTSYMNGVYLYSTGDPKPESFHPNVSGMQLGYGVAFENAMTIL